jgi:hypothetical protein
MSKFGFKDKGGLIKLIVGVVVKHGVTINIKSLDHPQVFSALFQLLFNYSIHRKL